MPAKYETACLQHPQEIADFASLLLAEGVRNFLEVGSKFGGSLWRIATKLPAGSRVVSIDLPHGDNSFKDSEPHLRSCVQRLRELGYDAHLILGDSTSQDVVEAARSLGPYDAVFIDANHTIKYAWADWYAYSTMSRIVAFHDIGWKQMHRANRKPIEVPVVWDVIKKDRRHREIKYCANENGIGVLWL